MSSLWTPGGERHVSREPSPGSGGASGGGSEPPVGGGGAVGGGAVGGGSAGGSVGPGGREPTEEEMRQQMAELQEQLARTPAEVVVANHAYGLFELAALHLSLEVPQLDQARVAIDALGCLVEGMGPRLGPSSEELGAGLAQLRMAFVQVSAALGAKADSPAAPGSAAPSGGAEEA